MVETADHNKAPFRVIWALFGFERLVIEGFPFHHGIEHLVKGIVFFSYVRVHLDIG